MARFFDKTTKRKLGGSALGIALTGLGAVGARKVKRLGGIKQAFFVGKKGTKKSFGKALGKVIGRARPVIARGKARGSSLLSRFRRAVRA